MAAADYRLMTEATGQRIAAALEALHLATVTGVKGDAEQNYRHGDVNLTPANIGAFSTNAVIDILHGGTGATTPAGARANLEITPAKVVANGSVTQGHIYCVHLEEATIANAAFEITYNPNDNQGIQAFGICLTNGTNIYCCTAKIALSNGQLSISDAYRMETGVAGVQAWSVSIRVIRMIA